MCIKEKCICATGMLPTEVLLLQYLHTYEELLVYGRLIQATLHKHVHFISQQQTSNTITVAPPLRKMNQIQKNIYTVFLIQTQMFHCKWTEWITHHHCCQQDFIEKTKELLCYQKRTTSYGIFPAIISCSKLWLSTISLYKSIKSRLDYI